METILREKVKSKKENKTMRLCPTVPVPQGTGRFSLPDPAVAEPLLYLAVAGGGE